MCVHIYTHNVKAKPPPSTSSVGKKLIKFASLYFMQESAVFIAVRVAMAVRIAMLWRNIRKVLSICRKKLSYEDKSIK